MTPLSAISYQLKARVIGIDASRAFLKRRTGIEEYSYQVIKYLRDTLPSDAQVVLYVRKKLEFRISNFESIQNTSEIKNQESRIIPKLSIRLVTPQLDFSLPDNWHIKGLWAPRFWTQIALSIEMLWRAPDVLFVPAHTVPLIHPRRTVVTIHGLEYEFCPEGYSLWERIYMHYSIKFSCQAASTVICVSENTKRDVMKLYQVTEEKIAVISEGYENNFQFPISNESISQIKKPYLLFIGRLETRKNIVRIIEAFEMLKEKYRIPHELILAGKPGYGYERICAKIQDSRFKNHIKEVGYVTEEEKWDLLKNADVFLFPTLYEGFGIPVLEAQSVGVPVVTSATSSLPEVAGAGAVLVDPLSSERIAEGVETLLSDPKLHSGIIEKATRNVGRYSWLSCAQKIADTLQ